MRPPSYKAIVEEFAASIRSGTLPAGTRLPTHRALTRERRIALATATRVYAELAAMGLVVGEPGRGTFVRVQSGYDGLEPSRALPVPRIADLSFNQPLGEGQAGRLRQALRALAVSGEVEALLRQDPPGGRLHERAVVATYLLERGIDTAPANVLLTSGAQQALDAVLRSLTRPGDVLAVDALSYPGIKLLASAHRRPGKEILFSGDEVTASFHGRVRGLGHMDPDDLVRVRGGDPVADAAADVFAVGAEAWVSEHIGHQPRPGFGDRRTRYRAALRQRGVAEARQRRHHDVERVTGVTAVRCRIGEERHERQHLRERVRPPVRHHQGQRRGAIGCADPADMGEVHGLPAHVREVLRKRVEPALACPPVESVRPVAEQLAKVVRVRSCGPAVAGSACGQPGSRQSDLEIVEHSLGNVDGEWLHDQQHDIGV